MKEALTAKQMSPRRGEIAEPSLRDSAPQEGRPEIQRPRDLIRRRIMEHVSDRKRAQHLFTETKSVLSLVGRERRQGVSQELEARKTLRFDLLGEFDRLTTQRSSRIEIAEPRLYFCQYHEPENSRPRERAGLGQRLRRASDLADKRSHLPEMSSSRTGIPISPLGTSEHPERLHLEDSGSFTLGLSSEEHQRGHCGVDRLSRAKAGEQAVSDPEMILGSQRRWSATRQGRKCLLR